ncbi:MAG: ABC transporter permease [Longimicrobiales bacterium]
MEQLMGDIRFACRSLLRRPAFASVAVLTLALGVGATTAIFSVVNGVLLRPLPYPDAERLVALWQANRQGADGGEGRVVSHPNFLDWRADSRTIEAMALYTPGTSILTGQSAGAETVPVGVVTADFLEVMGATPVLGRGFLAEEDVPNGREVVVVSHGFWQDRLGGRADVLGQTIELSGRARQIVGVAPPGFDFPRGARLWLTARNDDDTCGRACVYMSAVGRLADGTTVEAAGAELAGIAARLEEAYPQANTNVTAAVVPLQEMLVGDVAESLLILLLAVAMVLLIACANVANLLLVRGAARTEEVAVRAALGAGRRRLLVQLLTESLVLAVVGGLTGVVLAWWGVEALLGAAPADLPRLDEVRLDGASLGFALGLSAVTAVLFGLAPSLALARLPIATVLRQGGRGESGPAADRGRSALLVAEVGLSLMLLLGAGLLLRSFAELQRIDPGFRTGDVAQFTIALPSVRYPEPDDAVRTIDELSRRLEALPGVREVGNVSGGVPLGPSVNVTSFTRADRPPPEPGQAPSAVIRAVDPGFFETLDIGMIRGRGFTETDRQGAQPVVVVNQALVDAVFGGEDPIGKQIELGINFGFAEDAPRTVVGVFPALRTLNVQSEPLPELWLPYAQAGAGSTTFLLHSGTTPAATLRAARDVVLGMDRDVAQIRPGAMADLLGEQLARPRFLFLLLSLFAVLAVVLAAVGIYGVVAYVVARRTREIGVRMALGASRRKVLVLVLRQGMKPAALGIGLGLAGALLGARIMEGLLYGIATTDPMTFVIVPILLLGVTGAACLLPARRAARIPPATALRNE